MTKPCTAGQHSISPAVKARYDKNLPRYTSYPTAPHFVPEFSQATESGWIAAASEAQKPVSLYLHVPFCPSLCWYCACHTQVATRQNTIENYVKTLGDEMALVSKLATRPLALHQVHFGGGSPNVLSSAQLGRLVAQLEKYFTRTDHTRFAIELDPTHTSNDFIAALDTHGFNRASLGIQDFDETVQKLIHRPQSFKQTQNCVQALRKHNITSVNFDLVYGLPGQTLDSLAHTLDLSLSLAPERMALFGYAHVPWMKKHQRKIDETTLPGTEVRWDMVTLARQKLEQAGYVAVGLDHYAKTGDKLAIAANSSALRRNFQGYSTDKSATLIGLGATAISEYAQGYAVNTPDAVTYSSQIGMGQRPTTRGFAFSADDKMRKQVIDTLMCNMAVDTGAILAQHNMAKTTLDAQIKQLEQLQKDGLLTLDNRKITMTEAGKPLVRAAAVVFDSYFGKGKARHSKAV